MKKVMVKSLFDCLDYVIDYNGVATFAIISIQDSREGGFGFRFTKTPFCRDVLTIQFDDAEFAFDDDIQLFTREDAEKIIDFIRKNKTEVEHLIIHCYAGQSRSLAVGAFAVKMLGGNNRAYFNGHNPNMLVYNTLNEVFEEKYS